MIGGKATGVIAILAAAILFSGCKPRSQDPSASQTRSAALQKVFTADLLGERVPYLETLTGPAMRIDYNTRSYRIDGCLVTVDAPNEVVESVSLELSDHCTFNPALVLVGMRLPPLNKLTFGDFRRSMPDVTYSAECLLNCAHEDDDLGVTAVWQAFNPGKLRAVRLDADEKDPASMREVGAWEQSLERVHGAAWVRDRTFHCDPPTGQPPLDRVKVGKISFGLNIHSPNLQCNSASQPTTAPADMPTTHTDTTDMSTGNLTTVPLTSPPPAAGPAVAASPVGERAWYFVSNKACTPISQDYAVTTPDQLIRLFSRNGAPLTKAVEESGAVLLREIRDPDATTITLMQGKSACELARRILASDE